jgi:hypothetical protein
LTALVSVDPAHTVSFNVRVASLGTMMTCTPSSRQSAQASPSASHRYIAFNNTMSILTNACSPGVDGCSAAARYRSRLTSTAGVYFLISTVTDVAGVWGATYAAPCMTS